MEEKKRSTRVSQSEPVVHGSTAFKWLMCERRKVRRSHGKVDIDINELGTRRDAKNQGECRWEYPQGF